MMRRLLLLAILLTILGCKKDTTEPERYLVRYETSGVAAEISVVYLDNAKDYHHVIDVDPGWTQEMNFWSGQEVYLLVQNRTDLGSVVATIHVDGNLFKRVSNEGPYCVAIASGTLE